MSVVLFGSKTQEISHSKKVYNKLQHLQNINTFDVKNQYWKVRRNPLST